MATRGGYVRDPGGPNRHHRGPIWGPPVVRKSDILSGRSSIPIWDLLPRIGRLPGDRRHPGRAPVMAIRLAGVPDIPPAGRQFRTETSV